MFGRRQFAVASVDSVTDFVSEMDKRLSDPAQEHPIQDAAVQLRMLSLLRGRMQANEAPKEQFERLGIPYEGVLTEDLLGTFRGGAAPVVPDLCEMTPEAAKAVAIQLSKLRPEQAAGFKKMLCAGQRSENGAPLPLTAEDVFAVMRKMIPPAYADIMINGIKNYL